MKSSIPLLAIAIMISALTTSAAGTAKAQEYLSLGVGYYDILDNEGAVDFRAEYRTDIPVLVDNLNPWIGAEVTSEGSFWGGGGLLYDWQLDESWHLIPSIGAGLYAQGSSDLDLGNAIEFRSQLEAAYEFDTGQRAGLAFGHISNASLDSQNPGTEVLNLYWHVPY